MEVGSFVNGSIGIVVAGAGERVHMVWPADLGEGTYLRYVQLDAQANAIVTQNLELPGLLRAPRLAPAEGNLLHLDMEHPHARGEELGRSGMRCWMPMAT